MVIHHQIEKPLASAGGARAAMDRFWKIRVQNCEVNTHDRRIC
jgi:hypothetical protein